MHLASIWIRGSSYKFMGSGQCCSVLACRGCFNTYVESQWQISYGKRGQGLFLGQGHQGPVLWPYVSFDVFESHLNGDSPNPQLPPWGKFSLTPLWFTRGTHNVGHVCILNVHLWLSIREPVAFSRRINSVFWARSGSMTQVTWTEPVAVLPCSCRSDSLLFFSNGWTICQDRLPLHFLPRRLLQHREDLSPAPWSDPPEKKYFPP